MTKKIAVLITDRQGEALRMTLGLTLVDDRIDVYMIDTMLDQSELNMLNIELMQEMEMNMYTNNRDNRDMEYLSLPDIAQKLTDYDHVLAY